jgi:hypothetical protein
MKRAICLMSLASAAVFAGCGGGDDSTPETPIATPTVQTPANLSKDQFITQGDGFCAEVNAALGSISSDSSTGTSSAAGQTADLYEGMLEHLRGLGTPDDDTGLDDFYSAGDDLVAAEQDADDAAQSGDDTALASAESAAASAQSAFASAASSYGFQDCGQGPTTSTSPAPTATVPVTPVAPATTTPSTVTPAPTPGSTGSGGGTTGTGTGGGSTGTGGTSGSGGVGPG